MDVWSGIVLDIREEAILMYTGVKIEEVTPVIDTYERDDVRLVQRLSNLTAFLRESGRSDREE